jgi:uridylate kinase
MEEIMDCYKRVLLKMSCEALKGNTEFGIDPLTVKGLAKEIKEVHDLGCEVAIVVGGGNIWRGKTASELGMDRSQADYMGMLATIMNGLAIQDSLEGLGVPTRVMSAIQCDEVCEPYIRRRAIRHLEKKIVTIFVGGTGSPYFSTDTCSGLRAAEINADVILMAKNGVEGVYDKDPRKYADATLFRNLTHNDLIQKELMVMDLTAATLCKENNIDIIVFNMNTPGNIKKAVMKENIGTKIN